MKLKIAVKKTSAQDVSNTYSTNLSSYLGNASDWFDEIGLKHTTIKEIFLESCKGPQNVADPGTSPYVLNDELAIRFFILWFFSRPGGPVNISSMEESDAKRPPIFLESESGLPQFSSKINTEYLQQMRFENDPKGFFDPLYFYLTENIDSWTNVLSPSIKSEDIANIKKITNECFDEMLSKQKTGEIEDQYIIKCKTNYLLHLNETVSYLKTFIKQLSIHDEVSDPDSSGKNKLVPIKVDLGQYVVTWAQTKGLMSDSKGQIRKIIAYAKFKAIQQVFLNLNKKVLKEILNKGESSSINNKNIINYIYTNPESRYNESSPKSIFPYQWANMIKKFKFENLDTETDLKSKLSLIMDWVASNLRTSQITHKVLNGQLLTADDRIEEVLSDGRVRLIFPKGTDSRTYYDGELILNEGIPMGLMMFNMQKHRLNVPTHGLGSFSVPTQYDIENMVKSYNWNDMIRAQTSYHSFLTKYVGSEDRGAFNYIEKHGILLDYRNGSKLGYYWADLNSIDHGEEATRMDNCGRDSYGDIFSLRSMTADNSKSNIKELKGGVFWVGNSWLTVSVNKNGYIRQLKAAGNSKPTEVNLLEKIIDLLSSELNTNINSKVLPFDIIQSTRVKDKKLFNGQTVDLSIYAKSNLIQPFKGMTENPSFSTQHLPKRDFHIADLPDNLLKRFYELRPDFFDWSHRSNETELIDNRLKEIYRAEKEAEKERMKAEKEAEKQRIKSQNEMTDIESAGN